MNPLESIQQEAARIEEDALYSAKGHWEAAKPWEHVNLWIGLPTTACAAAAGVSAFSNLPTVSGALAITVALGAALNTFLNPTERHGRHCDAGNFYKALNNEARIFGHIECSSTADILALTAKLQELDQRRNELNQSSPIIPRRAFEAARRGIEAGEATHRVDQSG
jgi:hypothetical protein